MCSQHWRNAEQMLRDGHERCGLGDSLTAAACSTARWATTHNGPRAVVDAIFYLLRTGCQWRLLPREFPVWGTVYHYFRSWSNTGVWACLQRAIYEQARAQAGRPACPSVVIMDGQSVKTTERGGVRGFDAYKRVKGRKRHILVDTLGLPITSRVERPTCLTAALALACSPVWARYSREFRLLWPTPVTKAGSSRANCCGRTAGSYRL